MCTRFDGRGPWCSGKRLTAKRSAAPTTEKRGMSTGILEGWEMDACPVRSAVKAVDLDKRHHYLSSSTDKGSGELRTN